MKNFLPTALSIALLAAFTVSDATAQCKTTDLAKECRKELTPFKFSGAAETHIVYEANPLTVDLEFTAYNSMRYKVIFCPSADLPFPVTVSVYDGNRENKGRKKVFESNTVIGNIQWVFQPSRSGNYYIEYEIPASQSKVSEGCISFILGYQYLR